RERCAHGRATGRDADPALHLLHRPAPREHLPGRDPHLRRAHPPLLRLPADELLPLDPARAHRVGAGRRLREPGDTPPHRATTLRAGPPHTSRRERALGLERAPDRPRLPPRGPPQDADGRCDRVPEPLQPRRPGDDGGHVARFAADDPPLPVRAALLHPRAHGRSGQGLMARFDGKGVIVTGSGPGIGRAIAERFASEGAEVMCIGRTLEPLEETVALCGRGFAHAADVSVAENVDGAVAAALERWDRIDVLINNAGIDDETPFLEMGEANWDAVIATSLKGPFLMSQRVARTMSGRGGGVILHNASIDAACGDGPFASYN